MPKTVESLLKLIKEITITRRPILTRERLSIAHDERYFDLLTKIPPKIISPMPIKVQKSGKASPSIHPKPMAKGILV